MHAVWDERDFVRAVSHELRAPLTVCRGHLELLEDDPVERAATVSLVLGELGRMARIVDDLQVLADAGRQDFVRLAPLDPSVLLHELARRAGAIGDRGWVLDEVPDGAVVADGHRLTEAVVHLARNAVQHTEPTDTIGLGAQSDGDCWRLWVRDTGVGIEQQDQGSVFERFARGRQAVRRYRGTGVGLAIVRLVAEAHGGHAELRSAPHRGTTVTLVLPRDPSRSTS